MIRFTASILQFSDKGEKTGWSYIDIPADIATQLKPGTKTSFLVKGTLDSVEINGISLLPMGNGHFILPLKKELRTKLRKQKGSMLQVALAADEVAYQINEDLLICLSEAGNETLQRFNNLAASHQKYFSKWIESAKTIPTKANRIAQTVDAMECNLSYSEMIRKNKQSNRY